MTTDEKIRTIPHDQIVSCITQDSEYFRIHRGSVRAHIDVYDAEDDDGIEFIATVYEDNKEILSVATTFDEGFQQVRNFFEP
jgi:hypothetical protein